MPSPARPLAFVGVLACVCSSVLCRADELAFFEQQVRPLLHARCVACHGPSKQESDLRLDRKASILRGGASGEAALEPGDAQASLLLQYVRREVEGLEMPPDQPLSAAEIQILTQWVLQGAPWPEDATDPVDLNMEQRRIRDRQDHWAFQSLPEIRALLPSTPGPTPPDDPIDRLIASRRPPELKPLPMASRRTLIRRLKFDLLGLPPTPAEVEAFLADTTPDAYARLVDRYLAAPQYGERWGRHWLDVARYADTKGYAFARDRNYPFAYTYRDYVVDAWNQDLPFDTFVRQQLAADHLGLGADNRPLAALGFLTVGRKFNNVHDDIDDQIDVVTRGLLGITVACARCHDHKYDAIPTEDYYALYGVFASSVEPGTLPLIGDPDSRRTAETYDAQLREVRQKLTQWDQQCFQDLKSDAHENVGDYLLAALDEPVERDLPLRPRLVTGWRDLLKRKASADEPTLMPWHRLAQQADGKMEDAAAQLAAELQQGQHGFLNPFVREAFSEQPPSNRRQLAETYGHVLHTSYETWKAAGANDAARQQQTAEVRQLLWYFFDFNSPAAIKQTDITKFLHPAEAQARKPLAARVREVEQQKPEAFHRAMVLADRPQPTDGRVFVRGDARRPGDRVPRHAPTLLYGESAPSFEHGSGRLELAAAITSRANPLTPRVLANRLWLHHFGRPLVASPSDFGTRAEPPVQLPLLNYLARRLVNQAWSVKKVQREILLSAAYRRASGDHAENAARDPINQHLWQMNRRRLELEALRDSMLFVSDQLDSVMGGPAIRLFTAPERGRRRSVYGYVDRQDLPNLLRVFDFATPDQSAAQRAETTVPQQALFLLNSPFVLGLAERLAETHTGSDDEFVDTLYERLFGRPPTAPELRLAHTFLNTTSEDDARMQLAQILLLTNEFAHVD